ncbi:MAG: hypothetical protein M1837_003676 [Sclerophora amabilis]|nr:MAG: hypothetical protein M1837_003676 [Sclerophora amabilis]
MAPKSAPSAVKQGLILSYLQKSGTVHNIKELEKALPSVASINGMQVKDFLQALWDDDKIRVEKIGTGNWYWSFANEAKKTKENLLETLKAERKRITSAVAELRGKIEEASAERDEEGERGDGNDRAQLMEIKSSLHQEVEALRTELASYSEHDPRDVIQKEEEACALRTSAERWTDNIYSLEQYYLEVTGRDTQSLEQVRQVCYGEEYREGEGLAELWTGM